MAYDPNRPGAPGQAGWVDSNGAARATGRRAGPEVRHHHPDPGPQASRTLAAVGVAPSCSTTNQTTAGYAEGGPCATGELDMFEYSTVFQFPDPNVDEWYCDQIPTDETPDGTNWQAVCDEELEGLFKLQATQVDPAERQKTFHQITRHIFDNVYFLGLWQDPDIWAVGSRLQNVKMSGATSLYNIMEWDRHSSAWFGDRLSSVKNPGAGLVANWAGAGRAQQLRSHVPRPSYSRGKE
jgi:hypothetical protein